MKTVAHDTEVEWPGVDRSPSTPRAPVREQRAALIYVPGGSVAAPNQSLEALTRLIAVELDRNAIDPRAAFPIQIEGRAEAFGGGLRTHVSTVSRQDGETMQPVLDIYVLDYYHVLRGRYLDSPLPLQSFRVLWAIILFLPSLLRIVFGRSGRGKTAMQWMQVILGLLIFTVLAVYMAVLVIAVFDTVTQLPELDLVSHLWATVSPPEPAAHGEGTRATLTAAQALAVLASAGGLFFPGVRAGLARGAAGLLAWIYYFRVGERRNVLTGQFAALLEHVAGKPEVEYQRIDVVAYSFGTIIAMDALFPLGRPPGRRFAMVNTLVTIGCPFDFIRAFWRHYFADRYAIAGTPRRWLNVYSPLDIFGSSFRDDPHTGEPEVGIGVTREEIGSAPRRPENLVYSDAPFAENRSIRSIATFAGLRAHSVYWEETFESESSCFSAIVPLLYRAEPFLAREAVRAAVRRSGGTIGRPPLRTSQSPSLWPLGERPGTLIRPQERHAPSDAPHDSPGSTTPTTLRRSRRAQRARIALVGSLRRAETAAP